MNKKTKEDKIRIAICGVLAGICICLGIWFLVQMYVVEELNYFTKHFMTFVVLILIGIIALIMPQIGKQKYHGDSKGETTMTFVGFMLFICAILSIVISYVSL